MKSIANKTQIQQLYHNADNLYATEYTQFYIQCYINTTW